jgi:hypothetical protein
MRSVQFRLAALLLAPNLLFVHAPARATLSNRGCP